MYLQGEPGLPPRPGKRLDGQIPAARRWPLSYETSGARELRGGLTRSGVLPKPVFPILGVFRLNGQPKRDDGMIFGYIRVFALIYISSLFLVDAAPNFHKSGPMPSMRPTSWRSARNRRDRTGREAVKKAGVVLGYRASWHDRGPGGRHDFSGRSRGRGHPQPQTGLDRNGS